MQLRNQLRNLLWLVPLLLFVSSPLWKEPAAEFLKPRGGYDPSLANKTEQQGRDFLLDDIIITLSTAGHQEWYVIAEHAKTGKSDQDIHMYQVNARYTDIHNELTTISSNEGAYTAIDRHLIMMDNVVIKKPQKQQEMYTDLLHYYDRSKMVVSPVDVDLRSPGFTIQAGRMDYDLATDAYDFGEGVVCNF